MIISFFMIGKVKKQVWKRLYMASLFPMKMSWD